MKLPSTFIISIFFISNVSIAQYQLDWVTVNETDIYGGNGVDLALGSDGSVYSVGFYTSKIDLDPGTGKSEFTADGTYVDFYIQRLDANGNFLWGTSLGSLTGADFASKIDVDQNDNIYVTGRFSGTMDFDPGPNTALLTPKGISDIFLLKLDSNGKFVWVKQIGGNSFEDVYDLKIDLANNVHLSGIFSDSVDFDPGNAAFALTGTGFMNGFVLKLNQQGQFLWVKHIKSSDGASASAIQISNNGDIYVGGLFSGTVDFDVEGSGFTFNVADSNAEGFLQKLNSTGEHQWVKLFTGNGLDFINQIDIDPYGNILLAGIFEKNIDVDPGPGQRLLNSAGKQDVFIAKLNPMGDFIWVNHFSGSENQEIRDLISDPWGNINFVVYGKGQITFNFKNTTKTHTCLGFSDFFLGKIWDTGDLLALNQFGSTSADGGDEIEITPDGHCFVVGTFDGTVDFDPGAGNSNTKATLGTCPFILKLKDESFKIQESVDGYFHVYPNPSSGKLFIELPDGFNKLKVFDVLGRVVIDLKSWEIEKSQIYIRQKGLYFIEISNRSKHLTRRIVID